MLLYKTFFQMKLIYKFLITTFNIQFGFIQIKIYIKSMNIILFQIKILFGNLSHYNF